MSRPLPTSPWRTQYLLVRAYHRVVRQGLAQGTSPLAHPLEAPPCLSLWKYMSPCQGHPQVRLTFQPCSLCSDGSYQADLHTVPQEALSVGRGRLH